MGQLERLHEAAASRVDNEMQIALYFADQRGEVTHEKIYDWHRTRRLVRRGRSHRFEHDIRASGSVLLQVHLQRAVQVLQRTERNQL